MLLPSCEEIEGAVTPPRKIMRPYISEQPASSSFYINSYTVPALTAKIEKWVTGDGILSYQWYKFTSVDDYFNNEGGTAVGTEAEIDYADAAIVTPNADGTVDIALSYTPDNITAPADNSQYYYYVVVTNRDKKSRKPQNRGRTKRNSGNFFQRRGETPVSHYRYKPLRRNLHLGRRNERLKGNGKKGGGQPQRGRA